MLWVGWKRRAGGREGGGEVEAPYRVITDTLEWL